MTHAGANAVSEIVALAGGRLVGRTKLQKSACALELAGLGYGFLFSYKHFGPYSEQLKVACGDAAALGLIEEKTERASWGGWYSVFTAKHGEHTDSQERVARHKILEIAASSDSIALELAITAAFLASHGISKPWDEVASRKQSKATDENLASAKELYGRFLAVNTPRPLPDIV